MATDAVVRDNVIAELDFDPSLDAASIGVSVKNGVVTLTGHVSQYSQKISAEHAAQRVGGVRAVVAEIEVRLPFEVVHDDEEIARRALSILSWSVAGLEDVRPSVELGWVTLSGQTQWNYQRLEAERAIRALSGVKGVTNAIAIRPSVQPKDIKNRIATALKRNAQIESDAIKVDVCGSTVTLSGKVQTWGARRLAENTAWAVPGVTAVLDTIGVH